MCREERELVQKHHFWGDNCAVWEIFDCIQEQCSCSIWIPCYPLVTPLPKSQLWRGLPTGKLPCLLRCSGVVSIFDWEPWIFRGLCFDGHGELPMPSMLQQSYFSFLCRMCYGNVRIWKWINGEIFCFPCRFCVIWRPGLIKFNVPNHVQPEACSCDTSPNCSPVWWEWRAQGQILH